MFGEVRLDSRTRPTLPLVEMFGVLDVSVSGYRAWTRGCPPNRQRLTDSQMRAVIRAIHSELKGAYGRPCRVRERRARGLSASSQST